MRILNRISFQLALFRIAMARRKFTQHDVRIFKRLLELLELTQKEFAGRARLTEAWVSHMVAGNRQSAELSTIRKVADTFQKVAEGRARSRDIDEVELEEALNAIESFRTPSETGAVGPFFSDPGGPVPLEAKNYVDPLPRVFESARPLRDQIGHFLQTKLFSASIFGPPQCGVTSLLLRFMDQAERAGMTTALFDCKKIVDYIEPRGTDQALGMFTNYLGTSLAQFWGKAAPQITSSSDFLDWIQDEFVDGTVRLLVIDNLSSLRDLAMPFLNFVVRPMKSLRGASKVLVNFAFGIHPEDLKCFSEFRLSPILGTQIDLTWFSEEQTRKLAQVFNESRHADELYHRFGGQPFLTHVAIAYMRQARDKGSSATPITVPRIHKLAKKPEGTFAQHFNVIKDLLIARQGETKIEDRCLDSLLTICQRKPSVDGLHFPDLEIAEFLAEAGLVKLVANRYEPSLDLYCAYGKRVRKIYPKGK